MGATIDTDPTKQSIFSMDEKRRQEVINEYTTRYGEIVFQLNQAYAVMLKNGEYLGMHCLTEMLEISMKEAFQHWEAQIHEKKKGLN